MSRGPRFALSDYIPMQQRVSALSETGLRSDSDLADVEIRRSAVVVIGPQQVVTAIVLRGIGWHVDLATDLTDAKRVVRETNASVVVVRVASSALGAPIEGARLVALVDVDNKEQELTGYDAVIAIDDLEGLTTYVRSVSAKSLARWE
jgi:hypothetical protein